MMQAHPQDLPLSAHAGNGFDLQDQREELNWRRKNDISTPGTTMWERYEKGRTASFGRLNHKKLLRSAGPKGEGT